MTYDYRSSNKALQYDYDYILSQEGECGVCLTQQEIQWILANLDYCSWKTRWYSEQGTPIDSKTIYDLGANLGAKLMSACDDVTNSQIYQNQVLADLENYARKQAWSAENPQTIDGSCPSEGSNFNYGGSGDDNASLCQGSHAFVIKVMVNTLLAYGVLAGVAGAIQVVIGTLLGPLGWIVGGAAVAIIGLESEQIRAAMEDDTAVWDVACQLYNSLKGVVATQANWTTAIDALTSTTDNEAVLVTVLKNECGSSALLGGQERQFNYFLFLKCLGQSFRNVQGGLSDCQCADPCADWAGMLNVGTLLSVGSNYAEIQADWYAPESKYEIWVNWYPSDSGICCWVDHQVVISGTWYNSSESWRDCGGTVHSNSDPSGNAVNGQLLYNNTPFTIRIYRGA